MKLTRRLRMTMAVQNGVFAVLIVIFAGLLATAADRFRTQWDLTSSRRNTLTGASANVVRKLDAPVDVTAFATMQDARYGDIRNLIRDFIARYQRVKPNIRLEFVDPREHPKAAKAAGVQVNGELVVEYKARRERLKNLSEFEFTNALVRLSRTSERMVMSLEGHGERSLINGANHDLGDFGRQLALTGVSVSALNLAIAPDVPENVATLVIASPQVQVPENEVAKLTRFIDRGGNLLWLIDQEPLYGLEPIAERLGLQLTPGVVVDPDSIGRGGRPVMAVAAAGSYNAHPVVRSFRLNTLFPFARSLSVSPQDDWNATRLIEVAPRGWVETDSLDGPIVFDRGHDIPGPVTIALALERLRNERVQRVIVVGSANFLANMYLGNGGNLDLGINMVNWLVGDDSMIAIQPRHVPDAKLELSKPALLSLVVTFLIVLPLLLLGCGATLWWRRRRA
jgi:ABC-type uncharacterized transport system involved in gliding motility auxiliary subunit